MCKRLEEHLLTPSVPNLMEQAGRLMGLLFDCLRFHTDTHELTFFDGRPTFPVAQKRLAWNSVVWTKVLQSDISPAVV